MEITTTPVCRVGWQGQTLQYTVKAEGATEVSVPEHEFEGLDVRVTDMREVPGGIEATLEVEVTSSTVF